MTDIDRDKQRRGAALIEEGLQLMRDADPGSAPGLPIAWALCFGTASMEAGEDYSGINIMLPVEGLSWPLLIGVLRGALIKAERSWLKQMEHGDG